MVSFSVNQFDCRYNFPVKGVSDINCPRSNTVMYIGNKLKRQLMNLDKVNECLVFIEKGMIIEKELLDKHCFVESKNPAYEFIKALEPSIEEFRNKQNEKKYCRTKEGYLIGEDVELGNNTVIEPDCFIDHGVKIGDNTVISSGAVIRGNVSIGNNCIVKEKAVIGSSGSSYTKDENGNNIKIPSLGGVIINDNAQVGALATVCSGITSPTCIGEYAKIDDHVHVGHDVKIGKNTVVAASSVIAGYAQLGEKVFVGVGASIKNRVIVANNAIVGMAARVYKDVKEKETVLNEPAVTLEELTVRNILFGRLKRKV